MRPHYYKRADRGYGSPGKLFPPYVDHARLTALQTSLSRTPERAAIANRYSSRMRFGPPSELNPGISW